jgi:beta-mannanase
MVRASKWLPSLLWVSLLLAALLLIASLAGPSAAEAGNRSKRAIAISAARGLGGPQPCSRLLRIRSGEARASASRRRGIAKRLRCRQPSVPQAAVPAAPGGPMYWGAWIGDQLTGDAAPWDMGAVTKFEAMAGKGVSIVNFSAPFADCSSPDCSFYRFPAAEMEAIRGHGAIPFFSWASQSTPARVDQPDFQLADVIAGSHDAYIRSWAEAARDWGHPFFLRFNWEMNGDWFAWSEGVNGNQPGEYVAAWRHVHDIFTAVGATNATWVWCPNVDPDAQMQDLASLYPGDAYVDWTGLDGYNWGTNPNRPDRWRSFDDLYRATYDRIVETVAPSKPLIISEIGSTEHGGSKAAWIEDALRSASTTYPQLRGMIWFENYMDGMDWPIETSASATDAFAAGIQSPSFMGSQYGSLGPGPVQQAS